MSEGRILIVEDDFDTSEMLQVYFSAEGLDVEAVARGGDALIMTRQKVPDLIVLDIMLPDMDGYTICRELRTTTRTSHIPIIFLTQKDDRSDRIAGLELGADDYVTKPFDLEELGLRVKNAILSHQRMNTTDPRTGLPSSRLIEEQLRHLVNGVGWTYIEIAIEHLRSFHDAYGFVAADEVLRHTAILMGEIVDQLGTPNDFIGHAGSQTFVLITHSKNEALMVEQLRIQFNNSINTHYSFLDSEQGGIRQQDGSIAPMMTLSFGVVSDETHEFADIREITEAAADMRRNDPLAVSA